jgi:tetratricopeptide (TPR) repeat protein
LKNSTQILADLKKAYALKKDTFDINLVLGLAYAAISEYETAIPYLETAIDVAKQGDDKPFFELANAYLKIGQLDDALDMNTKAIENNQSLADSYMQRGIILSQNGDTRLLDENYQKAIEIAPDSLVIFREYTLRLLELKQYEAAYQLYDAKINNNEIYDFFNRDFTKAYEYESSSRLITGTSTLVKRFSSVEEYMEAYRHNLLFTYLLDKYGLP